MDLSALDAHVLVLKTQHLIILFLEQAQEEQW